MPITRGTWLRVPIRIPGRRRSRATTAKWPSRRRATWSMAASGSRWACSSRRWTTTSASVADSNSWPRPASSSRSSVKFSMIPLRTAAKPVSQPTNGWVLDTETSPWVAQRVWPMPAGARVSGASSTSVRRASRLSSARTRVNPSAPARQMPVESYPRYSSWASPSRSTPTAWRSPVYPTIPHMRPSFRCRTVPIPEWEYEARTLPFRSVHDGKTVAGAPIRRKTP